MMLTKGCVCVAIVDLTLMRDRRNTPQPPALGKKHDAVMATEVAAGRVDVGVLNVEPRAMIKVVVQMKSLPTDPDGEQITGGHEIQRVNFKVNVAFTRRNLRDGNPMMPSARFGDECAKFGEKAQTEEGIADGFFRVIMKAKRHALSATHHCKRLTVLGKELEAGVANLTGAATGFYLGQIRRRLL